MSKSRSIMSPTCSTRYLMYFSGFLVKGTLAYLAWSRHEGQALRLCPLDYCFTVLLLLLSVSVDWGGPRQGPL